METSITHMKAVKDGIAALFALIGEDAAREGLRETPDRFLKAYREMTAGYNENPADYLARTFREAESDEMIFVRQIAFCSLCEHHLLPFVGMANVAYVPNNGVIVGLSKIPRLVHAFARRLQVQERLTQQIGRAMDEYLSPQGVAVQLIAQHQCMSCRGIRSAGADMVTSYLSGVFRTSDAARAEFYAQLMR